MNNNTPTYTVTTEWKSPGDFGRLYIRRNVMTVEATSGYEAIAQAEKHLDDATPRYRRTPFRSTVAYKATEGEALKNSLSELLGMLTMDNFAEIEVELLATAEKLGYGSTSQSKYL